MSVLNLSAKETNQSVAKKLNLVNLKGTRERHGDYYLDSKFQFTVTLPNEHGRGGSISSGWLKVCRESIFLNAAEYADLVRCLMEGDAYEKLIRERIATRRKIREQKTGL
jgi:hypothetical protein